MHVPSWPAEVCWGLHLVGGSRGWASRKHPFGFPLLSPPCSGIQCIRLQRFKDTWGISPLSWGCWTFSPRLSLTKPWPLTPLFALCYLPCHPPSGGAIRWGYLEGLPRSQRSQGPLHFGGGKKPWAPVEYPGSLPWTIQMPYGMPLVCFHLLLTVLCQEASPLCPSPSPNKTQKTLSSISQCW